MLYLCIWCRTLLDLKIPNTRIGGRLRIVTDGERNDGNHPLDALRSIFAVAVDVLIWLRYEDSFMFLCGLTCNENIGFVSRGLPVVGQLPAAAFVLLAYPL